MYGIEKWCWNKFSLSASEAVYLAEKFAEKKGVNINKKTKKRLSKTRKGVYKGAQNIPIIVEGVEYRSAGEASNKLELPMTTIRWRVRSENKKYSNYYYKN